MHLNGQKLQCGESSVTLYLAYVSSGTFTFSTFRNIMSPLKYTLVAGFTLIVKLLLQLYTPVFATKYSESGREERSLTYTEKKNKTNICA